LESLGGLVVDDSKVPIVELNHSVQSACIQDFVVVGRLDRDWNEGVHFDLRDAFVDESFERVSGTQPVVCVVVEHSVPKLDEFRPIWG
jgi:hypothetical protein